MRRLPALFLCALPALGAGLKIDHVTLAGSRLDEMRQAVRGATGIEPEYGGRHSNHATEMALVSFPDGSYLELMAIQAGADPAAVAAHVWSRFLRANAGPCAFALNVPDVQAGIARFASLGIRAGAADKNGRTRPDGVKLEWETADAGPGPRGSVLPFLIHDFTPRANRVYPSGKPTSARFAGVGLAVVGVRDLAAAIALYRKAFALPEPKRQRDEAFGAELAWFEGTPVALAAPLEADSWLGRRIARFGDSPCAFVLASADAPAGAQAAWFGHPLSWFAPGKFDWRLGVWRQ